MSETPEELLITALKQSRKIILGETIGTDPDGNCTVRNKDGSVLAKSIESISAGSCVALKTDDGDWYAVSGRQSGLVSRKSLFKRKSVKKKTVTSGAAIALLQDVSTGSVYIGGDRDDLTEIPTTGDIVVDDFTLKNSEDRDDHETFLILKSDRSVRFSYYLAENEVTFLDAPNLIPAISGTTEYTYYESEKIETITSESSGISSMGIIYGYFLFFTYKLITVQNYEDNEDNSLSGYQGTSIDFTFGFVDLNNDEHNFSYGSSALTLSGGGIQSVDTTVDIPLPPPINSTTGRFVLFTYTNSVDSPLLVNFGTNDRLSAARKGDNYLLFRSYNDFAYRFYTGIGYESHPDTFLDYTDPLAPPAKFQFLLPRAILNEDLSFIRLLGITDESILRYVVRTLDDDFGEIQEVQITLASDLLLDDTKRIGSGFLLL